MLFFVSYGVSILFGSFITRLSHFDKQYVNSLNKETKCCENISKSFPELSREQLKAGVFDDPDCKKLVKEDKFVNLMKDLELYTRISFVDVVKNFLASRWAKNYKELVGKPLKNLQNIGANIFYTAI